MAEQMKPSGVEWIKDIPSSWEINKVKYLATEPGTLFLDGDWIESDVIEESGIRYLTTGNVGAGFYKEQGSGYISEKTFSELHCLNVYPGDLMISRLNEPIGRACIIPDTESRYVVAVDNVILRPNANYNKKFIMYGMNADGYAEHANMIARGATMSRISRSQLGQFWLAFPNIEEQQAIADFLDKECVRIDSIAADLEKQIELLQRYKKSLITETVTKGLDKSMPMKDSGVEWIGKIPAHWDVTRVKYFCRMYSGENLTSTDIEPDGDYPVYGGNGKRGYYSNFTNDGEHVLIGRQGALCGNVHLVSGKFWATDHAVVTYPTKEVINKYLYYLFQSMNLNQYSQSAAQPGLAVNVILALKTCLPSTLKEQETIVDFLDDKCLHIDQIILQKEHQFNILQQHKKSLIYEYVTGKKRVKEVR
ncbi:MAG: restriction endonuclease subunit S [Anaerotignum lactatifermentans]|uniref:Type I restriction enzyme, S subunit n=1 Tax=Anaerotignum lactatifermentans DSM 14214 TaxID=1121323 RepID=A0A1M6WCC5_9FIRM|nr:restriction endonuclease subunit S [Anaerotignum lactatifermentans]SHK91299.1 type I restriction enzyme, S subunit [[Clostridium] lactatifermentans DSM 14214] [Anaerotignum lactatifermentans DSM 14214]